MSQHPAPNTPVTPAAIHTTDPAAEPDLIAELRAALEAAGWKDGDRLDIRERALWMVCGCGCGAEMALTGPRATLPDMAIAALIMRATNSLPALLDRLDDAESETRRAPLRLADVQASRELAWRCARRFRDQLSARCTERDEARQRIDELIEDRRQAAELITQTCDLVRQVCDALGITDYDEDAIVPTLRGALAESVRAQAEAARLRRALADVHALADGWTAGAVGDRTGLAVADGLIRLVRDHAAIGGE